MQPSDYACIAGVAGIITYDLLAPPGQTISEACDRYLTAKRWLTELTLALIYLHVSNHIPPHRDPIHWAFAVCKRTGAPTNE